MKLLAVKMKHLFPLIADGQEKNVFTKAISAIEELVYVVMGTFKASKCINGGCSISNLI